MTCWIKNGSLCLLFVVNDLRWHGQQDGGTTDGLPQLYDFPQSFAFRGPRGVHCILCLRITYVHEVQFLVDPHVA